jgi:serine/threonine protein kinase
MKTGMIAMLKPTFRPMRSLTTEANTPMLVLDSAPRNAPEMNNSPPHRIRFGPFKLDRKAGELWQGERKILLQEQPFRVLLMLVERPCDLVTREDIQKRLWPNDTIVEFDHSINTAVTKLRQALGDSAENPRYVETVARRGYRLMVNAEPVQSASEPESAAPSPKEPDDSFQRNSPKVPAGVLSGKKVSHYRVLEIVGGGGMGVVYRAEDIKLGRRVALKFLPEESAKDPAALGRFEREARSASALEHPNICPIYEFGEHEGQPFLAMQLLEGQTLREMISPASSGNPPLALNKLLDLAIQITAGLDAAHRQGIVHRDIKPANIFVTSDSQVKILDFGLAKLARLVSGAEDDSDPDSPGKSGAERTPRESEPAPTPDAFLSLTGVAMGTAGYMSPEQVRGEKLDARTDLFSFGLVLYEMATGKRAFAGNTRPELHEGILTQIPSPVRELNTDVPVKLEKIIGKALEKDRGARYQTAAEIRADLEALKREIEPKHRGRWREMAAAVVVLSFITAAAFWFAKRQPQSPAALPDRKSVV